MTERAGMEEGSVMQGDDPHRAKRDPDPVTHPAHYALTPEPLDVIEAWGLGFHEGCVVKYVARWRKKDGVKDLRKAAEYLRRLIELHSPIP